MWMQIELIVLNAGITVFSLGLLVVSLLSYRKFKNWQLLLVSAAFLLFFIKGVIQSLNSLNVFGENLTMFTSQLSLGLFDFMILIVLFLGTLKS
jgi:hypothetical protein